MKRWMSGFTLIELVFVILIGSILTTVALSTFQNAQASMAARGAKTMYATFHQRARSRAIETGQTVVLTVDTDGDSAYIVSGGTNTDVGRFRQQLNVDLRASTAVFRLCMTPRGYADPNCPGLPGNSPISAATTLEFWLNADSSTLIILPMGQLVGM